jgi:hypothetical protein
MLEHGLIQRHGSKIRRKLSVDTNVLDHPVLGVRSPVGCWDELCHVELAAIISAAGMW